MPLAPKTDPRPSERTTRANHLQLTDRQPWERRDDESMQAYAAFVIYRDLDKSVRSLDAAFTAYRGGKENVSQWGADGTWRNWQTDHEWVKRANAFDDHADKIRVEARLTAIGREEAKAARRVQSQWLNDANACRAAGVNAMSLCVRGIRELDHKKMSPTQLTAVGNFGINAVRLGVDLESMALCLDELTTLLPQLRADDDDEPAMLPAPGSGE